MPPKFSGARVPVAPNACQVRGRVKQVAADPDGRGAVWSLTVSDAVDLPGYPNFGRDQVGQTISVFVPKGTAPDVAPHDTVEARVAFRGDEHGGRFVVVEDDARKI